MTLLEHADRSLLNNLAGRSGLPDLPSDGAEFLYPAPEAPPGVGEIRAADRRILLAAIGPGEEPPAGVDLLISMTGRPSGLSWEQVDRWLAEEANRYDPESRTGFLIRQFRAYLPEVGIVYFAGFDSARLDRAPAALAELARFYQEASDLFDRLAGALPGGLAEVRRARPEDLLAGFCYRDYTGPKLGAENFLRVALQVGQAELQIACWLGAGGDAHGRLRTALATGSAAMTALQAMEPEPLLWLWSPEGEHRIPLREVEPGQVAGLEWDRHAVAIQTARPFSELAGPGLVERIGGWAAELLASLEPVLTGVVH